VEEETRGVRLPVGETVLPEALRDAFAARGRALSVRKDQIVVAEGTEGRDVFLIRTGKVQISRLSRFGREVILRDMGPGQIFGEMAAIGSGPRTASVTAVQDSQLIHMRGDVFATFLGEVPQAGLWLSRQLAGRVQDLTDKVFDLSTRPVAARIQLELLRLAAAEGDPGAAIDHASIARLPTHAELAARIGSHREAVSRELGALTEQGLVRQNGRRLEILSLAGLRAQQARLSR